MSETISTAKPAIAVTPEASTAAPVDAIGAAQRLADVMPRAPLGPEPLAEQHAELRRDRDHERAEHDRHRVQRDPRGEEHERRPARREHDRHQRDERARERCAARRAARAPRPADRRAASRRGATATPGDRWPRPRGRAARRAARARPSAGRARACIARSTSNWRSSGIRRRPNDSVAVRRSGVMTVCEKYGGTASSRPSMRAREDSGLARREEVGERERRAEVGAAAALLLAVAKPRCSTRRW